MEQPHLSRRGLPAYNKNPSVGTALQSMNTRVKRISNPSGNEMILSNGRTGEIVTGVDLGFHQRVKVDKTQFVKLYIQGVSAFVGLSKAGARVLEAVISEVNKSVGKDMIFISPRIANDIYEIKKSSFMSGVKDLLTKEVLYEHIEENWYFINVNYIFNGDRLAFLKTYELHDFTKDPIDNPNQPTLPFDSEISCG